MMYPKVSSKSFYTYSLPPFTFVVMLSKLVLFNYFLAKSKRLSDDKS